MESNVKVIICLFNWILTKGISNLHTESQEVNNDEFLSLKVGRTSLDFNYEPNFTWGSIEYMSSIIHYALMLCSGYLLKKEGKGWVCFKLGDGSEYSKKKYDLPSVQQCSCLRTAYNKGDCRHIKMLKGYLLLQERIENEYKHIY